MRLRADDAAAPPPGPRRSAQYCDGTGEAKPVSEEDKRFFFEAVESLQENERKRFAAFREALLRDPTAELDTDALQHTEEVLEELCDHVCNIDNANDLHVVGGLPPLVQLLRSPHDSLRALAGEVIGTVVQNNPKSQQKALDAGALGPLLARVADEEEDATVAQKAMFAVSGLVRGFQPATDAFVAAGGYATLLAAVSDGRRPRVQRKALQLARHVALQTDASVAAVVDLGGVPAAARALPSEDAQTREAALVLLLDLAKHADFERQPHAVDQLRDGALLGSLRAIKARCDGLSGEDADAAREEAAACDALLQMLA